MNTQPVSPSQLANRAGNAVISSTVTSPDAAVNEGVDAMSAFPFPRDTIKGWIQEKVWNLTNQWIDPDKVYLHQFSPANSTHTGSAVTGWEHRGVPESSMTLTDAVASDFSRRNATARPARLRRWRISCLRIPARFRCWTAKVCRIFQPAGQVHFRPDGAGIPLLENSR